MVIKKTIHALKTRPHDERRAFAGLVAIVVMVVLTGSWGIFFFQNIGQSVADEQSYTSGGAPDQTAAAAATTKTSIDSIVQSTITSDIGAQTPGDTDTSPADTGARYNPSQLPPPSNTANTNNEVVKTLQAALHP